MLASKVAGLAACHTALHVYLATSVLMAMLPATNASLLMPPHYQYVLQGTLCGS